MYKEKFQFILLSIMLFTSIAFLSSCKKDKTAPVITSTDTLITYSLNSVATDPVPIVADDNIDGIITKNAKSDFATAVNFNQTGVYTVTYTVSDKAGNTSSSAVTYQVKNDVERIKEYFNRSYQYACNEMGGYGSYNPPYRFSETINNRVSFTLKNGTDEIYLDLNGNNVNVPEQTVNGKTFRGTGAIVTTSSDYISINFNAFGSCSDGVNIRLYKQ